MAVARSLNATALALGAVIAVQTIYTASFGVFDPVYHRPTVTLLCVAAAMLHVAATRMAAGAQGLLRSAGDVALFTLIAVGIWRFVAHGENAENMLVDFSFQDQLLALGAVHRRVACARLAWPRRAQGDALRKRQRPCLYCGPCFRKAMSSRPPGIEPVEQRADRRRGRRRRLVQRLKGLGLPELESAARPKLNGRSLSHADARGVSSCDSPEFRFQA